MFSDPAKWSVSPGCMSQQTYQSQCVQNRASLSSPGQTRIFLHMSSLYSWFCCPPSSHGQDLQVICDSTLSLSLIFYIQPIIMSCGFYPRFSHFYRLLHFVFLPGSAASWFSRLAVAFSLVSKTPFFSHFKPVFHTRAEIIY